MAKVLDRLTAPRAPSDSVRKHGVEEFHGTSVELGFFMEIIYGDYFCMDHYVFVILSMEKYDLYELYGSVYLSRPDTPTLAKEGARNRIGTLYLHFLDIGGPKSYN